MTLFDVGRRRAVNDQAKALLADLPHGGGHWTRDIQFTSDGKKMFVSVGSASNVDDPDTSSGEKNRADILEFNPDGSDMHIYAYGIRNAGGGLPGHQSEDRGVVVFGQRARRFG